MLNTLEAVKKGSSSKRGAGEYGVPRTTLQDRVLGNVEHGKKPGQQPYLNVEEEKDLVKVVEIVADTGFCKTRKQIKSVVEKIAHEKTF